MCVLLELAEGREREKRWYGMCVCVCVCEEAKEVGSWG